MRASVFASWVGFSGKLEGIVPWMYLDILGFVTCAIGNLVDPYQAAIGLPFVHPDGRTATPEEIATEWFVLKSYDCKTRNGAKHCPWRGTHKVCLAHRGHLAAKNIAKLRLTPEGISRVVLGKLAANNAELIKRFPEFEDWAADLQHFTHSTSWACGTGFRFPALVTALRYRDLEEALKHCHIDESGPDRINNTADDNWGLKPRNVANKIMLANAIKVQGAHLDPELLFYPNAIGDPEKVAAGNAQVRDEDIAQMQRELIRVGFNPGPIDGAFGPMSKRALIAFQTANALTTTGIYDAATKIALEAAPTIELPITPEHHVPPKQDVSQMWEEHTGSGGIIHVMPPWPSYRDA